MNIDDIKRRIYQVGRDVEVAQYNYYFEDDTNDFVAIALSLYQNDDGGFGGDLEPDSMNPNSSPFQTSYALEILTDVGFRSSNIDDITRDMVCRSTDYLMGVLKENLWETTIVSNNDYSSAIWWKYKEEHSRYNPTASILASLLLLLNKKHKYYDSILSLSKDLITRYLNEAIDEKHELNCLMRLCNAIKELQIFNDYEKEMYRKLKNEVNAVINPVTEWKNGYPTTPFDFPILDDDYDIPQDLIAANVEHLKKTLVNDHWNVTWTWFNDDPAFEMQAIKWQAIIAIRNLRYIFKYSE